MADGGGLDLLREWQSAMTSVIPNQLLGPLKRQTDLIGDVLERERKLQREVLGRAFAPLDAVFDLLEQSGATIRQQAEALEQAAKALGDTAVLMKAQAELFERSIKTLREPADVARTVAGLEKRASKKRKTAPREKT